MASNRLKDSDAEVSKYYARRAILLNGNPYSPGDVVPTDELESLTRFEALIRCGHIVRK